MRHSSLAELFALCLDLGQPCWASGPTAAALHRFDGFRLARPFHVTLFRGRRATRAGLVIHTTTELS